MVSSQTGDNILRVLALEIKIPLTAIARRAELDGYRSIATQATDAMTLIDGYLLTSQTEYGQAQLPLQTIGLGSIIYQVGQDVREMAAAQKKPLSVYVSCDQAVISNHRGLRLALGCLAQLAVLAATGEKSKDQKREIQIISYKRRNGRLAAGVLSPSFDLSPRDLARANLLYGKSHLALSTRLAGSGIRLAIAQRLAESLSTKLVPIRQGGLKGLGFELLKSEQLQLV